MRTLVAAAVITAALAPAAGLAATPTSFRDPHGIDCPAAPSGWFILAGDNTTDHTGGRTVVAPGDTEGQIGEVGTRGGSGVQVTCDYFTHAKNHVSVELLYALPTDPNPNNDFAYGCSSGSVNWDNVNRTFRLASPTQFADVAFLDPDRRLNAREVSAFEVIARSLLRNANGFAHPCAIDLQPTATLAQFRFSFVTRAGDRGQGLFYASGPTSSSSAWTVASASAGDVLLHVKAQGKHYPLTLHVRRAVDYSPASSKGKAAVKLAVVVKSSKLPSCRRTSTGTLTISETPFVLLKVCSQSFNLDASATISRSTR